MKYLLYSLLIACSACSPEHASPEAVTTTEPMPDKNGPDQLVEVPPTRPNFSSSVSGFIIVHGRNADSVSAQINQRLDQGYFFRGPLQTERTGPTGFEYIQPMSKEQH